MDALSVRGAVNCFVFAIIFGMGFTVAQNVLHFIGTFIR